VTTDARSGGTAYFLRRSPWRRWATRRSIPSGGPSSFTRRSAPRRSRARRSPGFEESLAAHIAHV